MTCDHLNFDANVSVARCLDGDGGPVVGFMAEIRIRCTGCNEEFEFLGLAPGVDNQGARVSIDGKEVRIAITPPGMTPNPLHRLQGNVRFNS